MRPALAIVVLLGTVVIQAQPGSQVPIHVTEPAGIRRSAFPVLAQVPLPRGALHDTARAKLVLNGADVPSQMTAVSRWTDGSIEWLDVDFNASPAPGETLEYALEYGPAVQPPAIARGLTVTEDSTGVQVGNIRFSRNGAPLLASVKYRDEAIASGANGLFVTDRSGGVHDLSASEGLTLDIAKRGPLMVQLKYSGTLPLDGAARATYVLTVEMPSSKSWVKLSAVVTDPARRVRDLSIQTPLALGPAPWVWDFGTTRWTYGALRGSNDSVVMSHTLQSPTAAEWSVSTSSNGREQVYETSRPDNATFAGWGHLQGGREVVAFALERPGGVLPGTYRLTLSGSGATEFRFTPAAPQERHVLAVYQHYVSVPVQIGAATSPAAILAPLVATIDRDQYVKSGVRMPSVAR